MRRYSYGTACLLNQGVVNALMREASAVVQAILGCPDDAVVQSGCAAGWFFIGILENAMLQRMNGWQRLWFVISIFGLVFAGLILVSAVTASQNIPSDAGLFIFIVFGVWLIFVGALYFFGMIVSWTLRGEWKRIWLAISIAGFICCFAISIIDSITRKTGFNIVRMGEIFQLTAFAWSIFVGVLYLAGKGIAWAIRGFSSNSPS